MTPEALEALKASIVKWEANERAETWEDIRLGRSNCPLCVLFNPVLFNPVLSSKTPCDGCPVMEHTKVNGCGWTPYDDACASRSDWVMGRATREAFRAAAHAETEFLRSLLPEGETV